MDEPRIRALHQALAAHRPRPLEATPGLARASVAVLVRPALRDLEILLIRRPTSETDPWSGQIAFPGGRRNEREDPLATAIREAREEVGVDLTVTGRFLGQLDEVRSRRGGPQIAVAPYVFGVPARIDLRPRPEEVQSTLWIPVAHLTNPATATEYLHWLPNGERIHFPAIEFEHHVIWGLTYQMLIQLAGLVRSARMGERT